MSFIQSVLRGLPRADAAELHPGEEDSRCQAGATYESLSTRTVQLSTLANLLIIVLTASLGGFVLLSESSLIDFQLPSHIEGNLKVLLLGFWVLACLAVAYIMRSHLQVERMKGDLFRKSTHLHLQEQYIQDLDSLLDACRAIHAENDPEKISQRILSTTLEGFQLDECSLLLSDRSTNEFKTFRLADPRTGGTGHASQKQGAGALEDAMPGDGRMVLLANPGDPVEAHATASEGAMLGAVSVPLYLGKQMIGVLNADKRTSSGTFNPHQLKLLSIFANQVSVSLENIRLNEDLKEKLLNAISTLAMALEAKDAYTRGHSQRVSQYSVHVARELGLTEEEIESIRIAGLLHDIGKIGIQDKILNKDGKLTDEEWKQIRKHPDISVNILSRIPDLKGILQIIRHHHERYDGKGYPQGLAAEAIPLGARILAVTDMLDALTSDRPYRQRTSLGDAMEIVRSVTGAQLDPPIVEALERIIERHSLDPSEMLFSPAD